VSLVRSFGFWGPTPLPPQHHTLPGPLSGRLRLAESSYEGPSTVNGEISPEVRL
jgi:hypothetical protein